MTTQTRDNTRYSLSDEQIWDRCDHLWYEQGIWPSKDTANVSCGNVRFNHLRAVWARKRNVKPLSARESRLRTIQRKDEAEEHTPIVIPPRLEAAEARTRTEAEDERPMTLTQKAVREYRAATRWMKREANP